MTFILGYDLGSSSIKATLLDGETGSVVASATSPYNTEMEIIAKQPGWAEQDPQVWWDNVKLATAELGSKSGIDLRSVQAIGISYQMHGLVIVDRNQRVLRPSIIWCDSRAVSIGEQAAESIGKDKCLQRFLNYPGNFTASKLKWVMENEPEIYTKIYKAMLPGDYLAMRLSGEIRTTPSGLSEGIFWDFQKQKLAELILDQYRISPDLIPTVVPTFSVQGEVTEKASNELGLKPGAKISYRAGDQPNNALSLNVLNPGELAATAGTSGVVYGVSDKSNYDPKSRVNIFLHVNHTSEKPRYGVLLCINGTGILNSWLKHNFTGRGENAITYEQMNELVSHVPVGSDGLLIIPYGNGAERTLENRDIGAVIHGLKFTIHDISHVLRAAQEGIIFALNYGVEIMRDMGIAVKTVRAGYANMFLSPLFREIFATVTGTAVELYNTDGSQGAARGAGVGAGIYKNYQDAFIGLKTTQVIEPKKAWSEIYEETYAYWKKILEMELARFSD